MTKTVIHCFTFGQAHMTNYPLPDGGRLADYYVIVTLPEDSRHTHREIFIEDFTSKYCPRPEQWAFEYTQEEMKLEYYPNGCLCVLKRND